MFAARWQKVIKEMMCCMDRIIKQEEVVEGGSENSRKPIQNEENGGKTLGIWEKQTTFKMYVM